MALPFIKVQSDYHFTLRFRIDNVRQYFHQSAGGQGSPPVQRTETFGPGWHFQCLPGGVGNDRSEDGLAFFLVVGTDGYPAPITWNIRGLSSHGEQEYFDLRMTHTFHSVKEPGRLNDWGWRLMLRRWHWDHFDTLRIENTLYITANVRAPVTFCTSLDAPAPCLADTGKCLDISHETVTTGGTQPCDARFTFSLGMSESTQASSGLQTLYAHQSVIERTCPRLAECFAHPIRAHDIVAGLFGEDSAGRGENHCVATAMRDGVAKLDEDFDSDAEEYSSEEDIDSEGDSDGEDDDSYADEDEDEIYGPESLLSPVTEVTDLSATGPVALDERAHQWHNLHSRVTDPPNSYAPAPADNDAVAHAASALQSPSQSSSQAVPEHSNREIRTEPCIDQSNESAPDPARIPGPRGRKSPTEESEWTLEGSPGSNAHEQHAGTGQEPVADRTVSTGVDVPVATSDVLSSRFYAMNIAAFTAERKVSIQGSGAMPQAPSVAESGPPIMRVHSMEDVAVASHSSSPRSATEQNIRTLTVTGTSHTTWEAFLFYLYTGMIAFAPIRSGGAVRRRAHIEEYKTRNPHRPTPCSCKSIYRIARMLDMHDLRVLALDHLRSQLSRDTILAEIFTDFAAEYEEVRELELQVLKGHWAELKGTVELAEVLKRVVRCNLAHATAIMGALW